MNIGKSCNDLLVKSKYTTIVKLHWYYLAYLMQVFIAISTISALYIGDYFVAFSGVIALILTMVPYLVRRSVHIIVPWKVNFLIALSLFLHIAGYSYQWYADLYPYYDKIAHFIASITISLLGFLTVFMLDRFSCLRMKRWQIFFFIIMFTLAFSSIWEIWEFMLDTLFGPLLSKPLQQGLDDTMVDLILDLVGALIVAFLGTWYLKTRDFSQIAGTLVEPGYERYTEPDCKRRR
jgi:hypothetical protein